MDAASTPTWVVVDIETTGLSPKEHRIAEIAVVVLGERGKPLGEAGTLLNPGADLGPFDRHGIRPTDAANAPTFGEIAGWLAQWLTGKVVVVHNLLFTTAFLDEEFGRAGLEMPHVPAICTMTHAPRYLEGLPGRTLEQCCAVAGITIGKPRSALTNARAVGELFSGYLARRPTLPSTWEDFIARARKAPWPDVPARRFRTAQRSPEQQHSPEEQRSPEQQRPPEQQLEPELDLDVSPAEVTSEFVVEVVDNAPRLADESDTMSSYLGALDTAVSDRVLSFTEAIHLKDLAAALAIFEAEQAEAHRAYLRTLATTASTDHKITDEERADLVTVGKLLDMPEQEVDAVIAEAKPQDDRLFEAAQGRHGALRGGGDAVVVVGGAVDPGVVRRDRHCAGGVAGIREPGVGLHRGLVPRSVRRRPDALVGRQRLVRTRPRLAPPRRAGPASRSKPGERVKARCAGDSPDEHADTGGTSDPARVERESSWPEIPEHAVVSILAVPNRRQDGDGDSDRPEADHSS